MTDRRAASFSFIHAADLHLDTPFSGIHQLAPYVAEELREASLAAFDAIVDLALERRCAFVVFAGDIYDGADRGLRAQLRFCRGLQLLSDEHIRSFVVHGNHDPLETGWSAVSRWPEEVTIFGCDEIGLEQVVRDNEVIATVQGISYAQAATTENLTLRFHRPDLPGLAVGVLHCNVEGDPVHDNYSPCALEDLRRAGLDYWALGHIHSRRTLCEDPFVVYSGNTQARSPKPSERGPKGALVVHVTEGAVSDVEFVACDRVRFGELECPIGDLADLAELAERLRELADEHLGAADGRSLVMRGRLVGRGPIHSDLIRHGIVDGLLSELRASSQQQPPFIWWDELIDESQSLIDHDEVRRRGDFAADVLAIADELRLDVGERRQLASKLADDAPRALARPLGEIVADKSRLDALLADATTIALDAVLGETG